MTLITPTTVNGQTVGIAELINLNNSFDLIALSIELEAAIKDKKSMLAMCIQQAIDVNVPARKIFAMLKDNIADNNQLVIDTIGNELVNKIKNLKL